MRRSSPSWTGATQGKRIQRRRAGRSAGTAEPVQQVRVLDRLRRILAGPRALGDGHAEQVEILRRKDRARAAGLHFGLHGLSPQPASNWFIVLLVPAALSAASPAKYSLWSSPMSEPAMFWCFTQAMPWRISWRCTPRT